MAVQRIKKKRLEKEEKGGEMRTPSKKNKKKKCTSTNCFVDGEKRK